MSTPTTTAERVAHDETLLNLYATAHRANARLANETKALAEIASAVEGSPFVWRSGRGVIGPVTGRVPSGGESLAWVEKLASGEAGVKSPQYWFYAGTAQGRIDAYLASASAATDAFYAIHLHETAYTGWSRFYLVTSSSGHVHSSLACSTCRITTTFAPVPSLSDSTEAQAVEILGETLCTVCFPTAPVKPSKVTQAQALALLEQGEAAFLAMRATAAAKASNDCPSSGSFGFDRNTVKSNYRSSSAICVGCNTRVARTATGKLRKHSAAK